MQDGNTQWQQETNVVPENNSYEHHSTGGSSPAYLRALLFLVFDAG